MRNEAVYRRRRAVALLILLAIVVLIIWGVSALVRAVTSGGNEPNDASNPKPTATQGAPAACDPATLQLEVAAKGTSFELDGSVDFAVSVTSNGEADCLFDGSDKNRVLAIRSGNDAIWSSADCASDEPRELLMSEGSQDSQTITWDVERSVPGCEGKQKKLRAGTYRAVVQVGENKSPEFVFMLT